MSLTSRASFPGTARLRSPAEFAPALKGRRLARGALFVLSVARPAADPAAEDPPIARLGLVIGKRYAPLSVSRNAIKRVIREAFRHKRMDLPAGDYVCRLHTRIPVVSLTLLKKSARLEMDAHFLRVANTRSAS
jgi:ribonuclease P protein component